MLPSIINIIIIISQYNCLMYIPIDDDDDDIMSYDDDVTTYLHGWSTYPPLTYPPQK